MPSRLTKKLGAWRGPPGLTLLLVLVLALLALPTRAQDGARPPWEDGRFEGTRAEYARQMWHHYKGLLQTLAEDRKELEWADRQLAPYRTAGGIMAGAAAGFLEAEVFPRQRAALRRIQDIEGRLLQLEEEWDRWVRYKYGFEYYLGDLSDARQPFPEFQDKMDRRLLLWTEWREREAKQKEFEELREKAEKVEGLPPPLPPPPPARKAPVFLGRMIYTSGGEIEHDAQTTRFLAGGLKPGSIIASESGSFSGGEGDHGYTAGPFPVSAPCEIKARLTGGPAAPNRWSLGNGGTGVSVNVRPLYGGAPGEEVHVCKAQLTSVAQPETSTQVEAVGEIPFAGEVYLHIGNPRGSGPLSGGNFPQSFEFSLVAEELNPRKFPVVGHDVFGGDKITASADRPAYFKLLDGTLVMVKPGATIQLSESRMGITRVDVLQGGCRVWWARDRDAPHAIEVTLAGKVVRPAGTDFEVVQEGETARVRVFEGAVTVGEGASVVRVGAGQVMDLAGGAPEPFDLSKAEPMQFDGLPYDPAGFDDATAQPYGVIDTKFPAGEAPPAGWLWEDPGADVTLEAPEDGMLRATVPDGNEMWGSRCDAPRLLRKVTGDFDLEATIDLETEAKNWASVEFLVKSPGCYMAKNTKSLSGAAAANYWFTGLCRGVGEHGERIAIFNKTAIHECAPAPDGPVRYRMIRRGDQFASYWSPDGERWDLMFHGEATLPDTIWVGWLFKRIAHDRMHDAVAVASVRDVKLSTSPRGTLDPPEWEFTTSYGDVSVDGAEIKLSLNGEQRGFARAVSGSVFSGDFDVEVSYDSGEWEHRAGQTRSWGFGPSRLDEKEWYAYVGCMVWGAEKDARWHTDVVVNNAGIRLYNWVYEFEPTGRLRFTREDGELTTYYWKEGDWAQVSKETDYRYREPVRMAFQVSNEFKSAVPTPLEVTMKIEKVTVPPPLPPPLPPPPPEP